MLPTLVARPPGGVVMLARIRRPIGPYGRSRGVTLVEMLVVVALVVLMMVILVQIFQSATGAISASRTNTELDVRLRQLDSTIRSDLAGSTAKMTPPNDPNDKRGYFEYGENAIRRRPGGRHRRLPRLHHQGRRGGSLHRPPGHRSPRSEARQSATRGDDSQPGRRGDLLPPQRQPLPARLAGRTRAFEIAHPSARLRAADMQTLRYSTCNM